MATAMTYLASTSLESEQDYPYVAYDEDCELDQSKEVEGDKGPM